MKRASLSIATRLTLLIGVIAVAVFGVVGTLLYIELERELSRREAEELAGRMEFVKHVLSEVRDFSALGELKHHLDDMVASHGNLQAWIATPNSQVIYGRKPFVQPGAAAQESFHVTDTDGTPLHVIARRLPATKTLPALDVSIAVDIRPTLRLLSEFRTVLLILSIGGAAAMLLLSIWATRRGLQPVNELSARAHAIGPQSLSRRLPVEVLSRELVDLAQSFNRVLDRVEESHHQLEAFNADVAHELRTPLTNMIGSTEVALSRPRSMDDLREVLASNLEELDQMKTMVNEMLFLARADRGERAGEHETVALQDVARAVAEFFEPVLEERRIRLDIQGNASVVADIRLLRRAVTNLVSNAVKYTESGNTIKVTIAIQDDKAHLCVHNPGPAISTEHLPRVFDRFYRADSARSDSAGGESHGLGLAIVKAIVTMHGGDVWATCNDGITEVGFSLPRAP